MGYLQIGNKILVGGEIVAEANKEGLITAMICTACNEMVSYEKVDGSRFLDGLWQCAKCSAVN